MKHISHNLEETQKIANDFVTSLSPRPGLGDSDEGATVVGLYGELGAGKTAFTQAVAKALGVEEKVASPTFVIMKVYELKNYQGVALISKPFQHLVHIDAYRMDSSDELARIGWKDIISNPKNLVLIEWPERVADIMPPHIKINLKVPPEPLADPNFRELDILY